MIHCITLKGNELTQFPTPLYVKVRLYLMYSSWKENINLKFSGLWCYYCKVCWLKVLIHHPFISKIKSFAEIKISTNFPLNWSLTTRNMKGLFISLATWLIYSFMPAVFKNQCPYLLKFVYVYLVVNVDVS